MNQIKEQLTNKIANLRVELDTASDDDRHYIESEIMYLTDDLHNEFAKDCIAEGEHFHMTTSEGGYDVCLNCGAKQ
jgi:hypothetical protein